jgi:hypothetical protein
VYATAVGTRFPSGVESWVSLPQSPSAAPGEEPTLCPRVIFGALNAGVAALDDAQLLLINPGFMRHQHWATFKLFQVWYSG